MHHFATFTRHFSFLSLFPLRICTNAHAFSNETHRITYRKYWPSFVDLQPTSSYKNVYPLHIYPTTTTTTVQMFNSIYLHIIIIIPFVCSKGAHAHDYSLPTDAVFSSKWCTKKKTYFHVWNINTRAKENSQHYFVCVFNFTLALVVYLFENKMKTYFILQAMAIYDVRNLLRGFVL